MKRSVSTYILIFLVFFQVISALPAGWSFITVPSGAGIGISTEMLDQSPFPDFLIPGLFLFIFLGLFPCLILYGLITKKELKLVQKLNLYKNYHWSWTFSYYLGLLLILWVNMELYFGIPFTMLHFVYTILGVVIVIITQLPGTRRDFKI